MLEDSGDLFRNGTTAEASHDRFFFLFRAVVLYWVCVLSWHLLTYHTIKVQNTTVRPEAKNVRNSLSWIS